MDPADAPASEGVMIALLPTSTDWCKIDLPHMTLVYAGKKSDLKPSDFNNIAKDASSLASLSSPFCLRVIEKTLFGPPDDQVEAFRLFPTTELWAMRRVVEGWNASDFPFNPHVTIGPIGSLTISDIVPSAICFNRVYVGWGDESITFNLTRGFSSDY